jgi:hypothetical protein
MRLLSPASEVVTSPLERDSGTRTHSRSHRRSAAFAQIHLIRRRQEKCRPQAILGSTPQVSTPQVRFAGPPLLGRSLARGSCRLSNLLAGVHHACASFHHRRHRIYLPCDLGRSARLCRSPGDELTSAPLLPRRISRGRSRIAGSECTRHVVRSSAVCGNKRGCRHVNGS